MNFEGSSSSGEQFKDLLSQIAACREQSAKLVERVRVFKSNFGVREMSDGSIDIDFKKMVERLGPLASATLRSVINEMHGGASAPGEGGGAHPLAHLVGETVTILSAGDGKKPKLRILPKAEAPRVKRKYTKRAKAA